ncbi:MAG: tetratricopeptide repeat protein [Rhodothermales bacterium]|nr:tetratricopeptide repeat protein [Rhodothermales bacterium]
MAIRYTFLAGLLALLAAGLPATAQAQANGTNGHTTVLDDALVRFQAKRGLDLLYDMKFDEADRLFEQIDQRYPEHPIGPFLGALNTWWKILLDFSDTSNDEAFYAAMDEVIARSDRLLARDDDHFDAMFFKGAALGFRGRLRSNRRDWVRAAHDGKRAMDYVLAVAAKDPSNHDYAFGKGIYDYYAAVIPDRYPFVKPVMAVFPKGNRVRGLEALERTATQGYYIQTEAAYFLLQIYYLFEEDFDESVRYVTLLRERHPGNAFFHTIEGRIYARWGHWRRAADIFEAVLARYQERKPGYNAAAAEQALYYLARSKMAHRRHDDALADLLKLEALAARSPDDTYFKVMGRLRQGMVYDALGQRDRAVARYRQVLSMNEWAGSHDRAQRYLDRPYGR